MSQARPERIATSVVTAAVLTLAGAAPAQAQAPLLRIQSLSLEGAVKVAAAALADCRARGAVVAVAVVDRTGNLLALQRDPLAGMHTPDTATRKAWTAVSFRGDTLSLEKATGPDSPSNGIRYLPNVAMLGGGVPIEAAGSLVGAVGVSGAPSGEMDDACGKAGIGVIQDDLELGS